jgi:hypothetical protein
MPVPTVRLANNKDIEIELNRVLSLLYEQVRAPLPVSVFQSVRGNVAEGVKDREIFLELDLGVKRLCVKHNGHIYYVNLADPTVTVSTSATPAPNDAAYVVAIASADLTSERVLTGTANQVTVTDGGAGSSITLSTPQNLHTGATPQFTRLGLGNAADASLALATNRGGLFDGSADEIQLRVQGHSTQTANVLEIENSAGTNQLTVNASGDLDINGVLKVDGTQVVSNQQSAITSFTDSSGGTADNTIAAAGAGYSQSDENNFRADVAQKMNAILTAIRTHGLIAT